MTALFVRLALGLLLTYVGFAALLWLFQSRFIYPAPQTVDPLPSGYSEVAIATEDNLSLRAFYRPAANGKPTAIFFHGNGGSLAGSVCAGEALAQAGIGQLLLSYRGYGGNAGSPSEDGFYKDGEAAIAWLGEQGIGPAETIMIGNSIGTGVASEMAVRHSPKALILIAPFTSLVDLAAEKMKLLPVRLLLRDRYTNAEKLERFAGPLLIQHGDADTLIPDRHGRRLAELTAQSEFQSFANAGHNFACSTTSQIARRDWILGLEGGV